MASPHSCPATSVYAANTTWTPRRSLALLIFAGLQVLSACNPWQDHKDINEALTSPESFGEGAALILPTLSPPNTSALAPTPRLLVQRNKLLVETTAFWMATPPHVRNQLKPRLSSDAAPFLLGPEPGVIPLGDRATSTENDTLTERLSDALEHLASLRHEVAALRDTIPRNHPDFEIAAQAHHSLGGVTLLLDQHTSMSVLTRIIDTVLQSQTERLDIAFIHNGQLRALTFKTTGIEIFEASSDKWQDLWPGDCATHDVLDTIEGWLVQLRLPFDPGPFTYRYHYEPLNKPPSETSIPYPPTPHPDNESMRTALALALKRLNTHDKLCAKTSITVLDSTRITALINIMAALTDHGYTILSLRSDADHKPQGAPHPL